MQQDPQAIDRHPALLGKLLRRGRARVQARKKIDMKAGEKGFGSHKPKGEAGDIFSGLGWFDRHNFLRIRRAVACNAKVKGTGCAFARAQSERCYNVCAASGKSSEFPNANTTCGAMLRKTCEQLKVLDLAETEIDVPLRQMPPADPDVYPNAPD
jgi:hypothetical protein